ATEFAVATLSVLYLMLPAQLESFSGDAKESVSKGMAAAAVQSLRNVRFFIRAKYSHRRKEYKNLCSYFSCKKNCKHTPDGRIMWNSRRPQDFISSGPTFAGMSLYSA